MLKRKLDYLNRITLPKPMIEKLNWKAGDEIHFQIAPDNNGIFLQRKSFRCYSCQSEEELVHIGDGLHLCKHCLIRFSNQ